MNENEARLLFFLHLVETEILNYSPYLNKIGLIFIQNCLKYSKNEPELEKRVKFIPCFELGLMDIKEIQDLIKFVAKSGVSEVELEIKGVKIVIKTQRQQEFIAPPVQQIATSIPMAAPAPVVAAPAPSAAPSNSEAHYVTIKSPMIGTFYRRPSPDKPIFANVGDEIKSGKVLCIIEAMKLFNEIEAEISGKIVKILVDDASPVEYDQPLFLVDPS